MSTLAGVRHVRAEGDAYALGAAHGQSIATRVREFLDDGKARLDHVLRTPVPWSDLCTVLPRYHKEIAEQTPELGAEIAGLADGAGLSLPEATLLQVRREILGYNRVPTAGDCTTYASASGPVLAQTVDLNGDLDDQISVLEFDRGGRRSLVLSFGGLLGYLGINDRGLAVGLNLVLGGQWRYGLPPYLAIRHLLDTTASVDEAIEVVRQLRLTSSRSLMLCDRTRACSVEILGDEVRVVEDVPSVHANHFLHPDFVAHDELNVFARNSSRQRLETAQNAVAAMDMASDPEQHFELLATPPLCVPDDGDVRRERTVAAVVLRPDLGTMHLRPGDPSRSETQVFALA